MKKRLFVILFIILLSCLSSSPYKKSKGWNQNFSDEKLYTKPFFSTHQWLALEALRMFDPTKIQWITNNYLAFWNGVEAPTNTTASELYVENGDLIYGDINDYVLYFEVDGITVKNDNLATRAYEEYTKLFNELSSSNINFTQASFYAGALSHYVSQAGTYRTTWDNTQFDPDFNITNWEIFENLVKQGNTRTYFPTIEIRWEYLDLDAYYNEYFNVTPSITIGEKDAYNATINLANQIYPYTYQLNAN